MTSEYAPDKAITVRNVTRAFGQVQALDGVSFDIATNSICGLLGSNGAGKTTLMALIAGHDRPTSGQVQVLHTRPFESEIVAQATSFIRDNQRYPDDYKLHHVLRIAKYFHANWDANFAAQLVQDFSIPAKTQVKKFSRGQISALSIVVALASRAPITIFDEPYLGLDVASRHRFYELLISDYAAHPRTIIISTHLVGEMESIFDHAIILEKGKVVLDEQSENLVNVAYQVSGRSTEVELFGRGRTVLSTRTLGALSQVIIAGPQTDEVSAAAAAAGINLDPVSLQDLVGAYGTSQSNPSTREVAS